MPSNYKKLGPYIREIDVRNEEGREDGLLGLSTRKVFIDSVANTFGTDFTKYKIVRKHQFTYVPDTSRRGDKIAVALLETQDLAIVSQAYIVFEVIDHSELDPEYLMMWFRRPEFDRYARFKSHGSVRELFDWDEMCDTELPIPHIDVQRAMVREYNTITHRIALNEQLNQKLEETAQTLYRYWFVDFEFPYDFQKGEPSLQGQPYKSSGGEMKWCEELEKEIPRGWGVKSVGMLSQCNSRNVQGNHTFDELLYLDTGSINKNKIDLVQKLTIGQDVIPSRAKRIVKHNDIVYSTVRPNLRHYGLIKSPARNMVVSTGFAVITGNNDDYPPELIFQYLIQDEVVADLHSIGEMSVSTYPGVKPEDILEVKFALPNKLIGPLSLCASLLSKTYDFVIANNSEFSPLNELANVIMSKMSTVETGIAGGVGVG